jgi:PAS domain S-box-containing protein
MLEGRSMKHLLGMQEQFLDRLAKLEQREAQWRSAIANAPAFVAIVDSNGTIQFLNRAYAGMSVENAVDKPIYDFVLPEYYDVVRENLQQVLQTGESRRFELIGTGPNAPSTWYEMYLGPVKSGEQVVAATVTIIDLTERKRADEALTKARDELERRVDERTAELVAANEQLAIDITKRKAAEEALRQSEEKYRGLLEACPDAVVMADLSGKALFASRQTWRLLGIPESVELVGRSIYEFVTKEDQRRSAENLPRLEETGIVTPTEYTAIRQDGTTLPTEISAAVSRDAQGIPVAFMAVIRDITERKRAEEALRQSRDKLQKEQRTLKHLLQSSDHERQLIAYEIHDGLAQQLAGAIMQFQTFDHLKEAKPKEAAKAYDAGMTMLQQGHFEARRLISGVRPPILDEEGVVAAVAHLVNEQRRLKGPKIDYRNNVDFDRLAPILENGIYRIAQEGLANACLHSKSERVRVMLQQRDDRVQIDVRDWGIGFDIASTQENRFGLVGIRHRARLLGGKCSIRSAPGQGTRITVDLPVVTRE